MSSNCDIVQGSKVRRDELMSKTFNNGGCREYAAITSLLPSGSGGMHHAIPRRKDFGAEGAEMDEAHAAAMLQFSVILGQGVWCHVRPGDEIHTFPVDPAACLKQIRCTAF